MRLIYEINIRVWLKQFSANGKAIKLIDVPLSYWEELKNKGFQYIWLMGIWKTVPSTIKKYCFVDGLIKEYGHALPDWKEEDVIGSPYAIDRYETNPNIATKEEIIKVKNLLNGMGLKLILDFIPNHYSAETSLLNDHPDIFLNVNQTLYERDSKTFFIQPQSDNYFAHGKDPYFEAWQDTIQVNYFNSTARDYMTDVLIQLTELCDGVRCDMAMLMLNSVFCDAWQKVKTSMNYKSPVSEFWSTAISKVKSKANNFLFIAEAYWDLEFQLQSLGFDFTYDKRLYDRLIEGNVNSIYEHLNADKEYQNKSLRFIENHDEDRSATTFKTRLRAAAVIIRTLPGLKLFYDGQFEGRKTKLPVQLGREPKEEINLDTWNFYERLLIIANDEIFNKGVFNLLSPEQAWLDNDSHKNILSWIWNYKNQNRIVVVNYSDKSSVCRIKFEIILPDKNIKLIDILNEIDYFRSKKEITTEGFYIQLEPFESHIFSF